MNEAMLERISNLERSNRRWKFTSAILAAALLSVTVWGALLGFLGLHDRARDQDEQARLVEMRARVERWEMQDRIDAVLAQVRAVQGEAARKQAELVLQPQNPKKD